MNKTIFVYFSYSGDNDKLAALLKRDLACDILKLEPATDYTNNSIKIIFQGGKESSGKKTPDLKPYHFDMEEYDNIILGTPVWAWTFSPVLRRFLQDNKLAGKKIILLCTHRGMPGKTMANLTEFLANNQIVFTKEIHAPIADEEEIKELIQEIKANIKQQE